MLVIGERINTSRNPIALAVTSKDEAFIQKEVKMQAEAGADYIEVNAGSFMDKETEYLKWLIDVVQDTSDLPLCIDSPDYGVIKSVLPLCKKTPMINSISLEGPKLEEVLTLVSEYGAKVIALCQSDHAIANSVQLKMEMAGRLVEALTATRVPLGDLFIDPLVYPLGTDSGSAAATLEAIAGIMDRFPGVHTICGLSNVSYGLPNRGLINATFLVAGIFRGLDAAILDPTDKRIHGALKTSLMILDRDDFCTEYLQAFREGLL